MKQAFQQSKCDTGREQRNRTFQEWREQMELLYPQFQFWSITLKMQMDYLLFLRSIQSRKFSLSVHSLGKRLPWTFFFDHFNYAQWMSVHHYDMEMLQESNCSNFHKFEVNGNFVSSRTKNAFSSMRLDQWHEHLNKDDKRRQWNG